MESDVTASDSVLEALGVNREDYTKVKAEQRQRQEETIMAARTEGVGLFTNLQSSHPQDIIKSVYLGDRLRILVPDPVNKPAEDMITRADRIIQHIESVYQLPPDQLSNSVHPDRDRYPELISPDDLKLRIRYLIEGFTAKSIQQGWFIDIGLRAVNTVTPGGILKNQYTLERIKEKAAGNQQTMTYFADAIQTVQTPQTPATQ